MDPKHVPAYPTLGHVNKQGEWEPHSQFTGMTLRDYFAAKALPALIPLCRFDDKPEGMPFLDYCAAKAYEASDAMLRARTK